MDKIIRALQSGGPKSCPVYYFHRFLRFLKEKVQGWTCKSVTEEYAKDGMRWRQVVHCGNP